MSHQLSMLARWRMLPADAHRYLAHLAMLTFSLAVVALYYNLAVLALGYERGFLGILNTTTQAVAAILSLPLWLSVQRLGLRGALVLSAILQATSVVVFAAWPAAAPLVAAAALMGVGGVLAQVAAAPFMMRVSDDATRDYVFSASAALAIGLNGVGNLGAGFLTDALGGIFAAPPDSSIVYRAAFALAGIGALISIPPLLLIREPAAPRQSSETQPFRLSGRFRFQMPEPLQVLLKQRAFVAKLLLPPFLISWGAALLIPYLNLYFRERFGIDNRALGIVFAGFDVATGIAALAGPMLAARMGKMHVIIWTRALGVPMLIFLGLATSLWAAVAAALARVVLFNMAAPLYDAYAMERIAEPARPFAIGLLGAAYSIGFLAAPLISTAVQERFGFGPLFVVTALLYALSVALTWWFFGRGQSH